jgi:hypothetical protein
LSDPFCIDDVRRDSSSIKLGIEHSNKKKKEELFFISIEATLQVRGIIEYMETSLYIL